jgi:hypothetical protein
LTKEDISEAINAGKQAADNEFKQMVGKGAQYSVSMTVPGEPTKRYPLLGLCGFASLHFKGVKNKNMLVKAGLMPRKSYYGGYDISANELHLAAPEWARKANSDAAAYYQQSVDLKEKALREFLKSLQAKGYLQDAYVTTHLD